MHYNKVIPVTTSYLN